MSGIEAKLDNEFHGLMLPDAPDPVTPFNPIDHEILKPTEHYIRGLYFGTIADALEKAGQSDLEPTFTREKEKQQLARRGIEADISIPVHSIARGDTGVTFEVMDSLREQLRENDQDHLVNSVVADGMFVSVGFNRQPFAVSVLEEVEREGELYGANSCFEGRNAVFDNSAPNIAKFMSVAHLRSTVIGESLARIFRFNGANAIRDNHLGDWGNQFGILSHATKLWGADYPGLQSDDDTEVVTALYGLYVKINDEIAREEETTGTSRLKQSGREWFQRLENGDEEAIAVWQWATSVSLKEFEKIYEKLGVEFEYWLGESSYSPYLDQIIDKYIESGLATYDDEGVLRLSLVGSKYEDEPMAILSSEGTTLYSTRDLATLATRELWFDPIAIVYSVDNTQGPYFQQVFEAHRRFTNADEDSPKLVHAEFGRMSFEGASMSTRKGNVEFLIDALDEGTERARARLIEGGTDFGEYNVDELAGKIAVGALVYFDLADTRKRRINFDYDDALNFEGNTGPYHQYQAVRLRAIFEKAEAQEIEINYETQLHTVSQEEYGLLSIISEFPEAVALAAEKYEPSVVAKYVHRLASSFSSYYGKKENVILAEKDPVVRNGRLRIAKAVQQTLLNSLELLNIPIPEKM